MYRNIRYTLDRTHALQVPCAGRGWDESVFSFVLDIYPAVVRWECGNPEGISKRRGKGGKPAFWLSMLSTPSSFPTRICTRRRANRSLISAVRSFRQLGIVIVLLVSYLTPAMACMVSDVQMNAEERACCRMMQNHCEQMGMQSSHGCCQKAPQSSQDNALVTKGTTYHPVVVAAIWPASPDWFQPVLSTTERIEHLGYSPPQSPPGSISVLRI